MNSLHSTEMVCVAQVNDDLVITRAKKSILALLVRLYLTLAFASFYAFNTVQS